jgi:fructokinase
MRKIYGIGETVFDIIFKDGNPQAAKAGGSVLNSMISLGRLGLPVSFISEYGLDNAGNLIDKFLKINGVDTRFVNRYQKGNTTISLAFLDEKNDAHYNFYKDHSDKRFDIDFPLFSSDDILQFGSFYAIWPEIREEFKKLIMDAAESNALVLYDPNFRKTHASELISLKPMILENMEMANIVRGSKEDFEEIFGVKSPNEAWKVIKNYCKCLVYTVNTEGVFVFTPHFSGEFPVKKIEPVSTIGAGDNFNAGVITAIYRNNILRDDLLKLEEPEWLNIITTATAFATHVCLSIDNYLSVDFAKNFNQ